MGLTLAHSGLSAGRAEQQPLRLGEIDTVNEERSAKSESFTDEGDTLDVTESGNDSATEIIETLKALPDDTAQVIVTRVLQELSHVQAKKEIVTSVVGSLPDDATEAKKVIAVKAMQEASGEKAKKEVATSVVEALPDNATEVKTEIATSVVENLPDGAVAAKTEIATKAVESLPDDAAEAKKKVVQESVRDFSPEFRDYLIADLVTMRHLFRRVFVWTSFGASAVAIVIAILTAVGVAFGGSGQTQNLLWVVIPVATLLLGYSFGRKHSEQADIKRLRKQNPKRRNGSVVNSRVTPRS